MQLNIEKELKENIQYVSKPEFGTGSTDIIIFTKKKKLKTKKKRLYKNTIKEKKEFCYALL